MQLFNKKNNEAQPSGGRAIQELYTRKLETKVDLYFDETNYLKVCKDGIKGENPLGSFEIDEVGNIGLMSKGSIWVCSVIHSGCPYVYEHFQQFMYPIQFENFVIPNIFIRPTWAVKGGTGKVFAATVENHNLASCTIRAYTDNITTTFKVGYEAIGVKQCRLK